ncbi:hypothetical protein T05_16321 [Trichinella murrelli]|uniref:Uncharacterized protein n=1 Tax=Trichinella murrelli TaxID=144512 RepID=A0A0V0TG49_9BILA|nr:hypothetical protein T05_16321 [Trichinella murrelli]
MLMNSQYIIKVLKVESIRKICCVPRRNTGKTSADKPEANQKAVIKRKRHQTAHMSSVQYLFTYEKALS